MPRLTDANVKLLAEGRSAESVIGVGCEFALKPLADEIIASRSLLRELLDAGSWFPGSLEFDTYASKNGEAFEQKIKDLLDAQEK